MTYKIIRHRAYTYEDTKIIHTGLTLKEAQEHCKRDDTHGEGWFDAYHVEEDGDT